MDLPQSHPTQQSFDPYDEQLYGHPTITSEDNNLLSSLTPSHYPLSDITKNHINIPSLQTFTSSTETSSNSTPLTKQHILSSTPTNHTFLSRSALDDLVSSYPTMDVDGDIDEDDENYNNISTTNNNNNNNNNNINDDNRRLSYEEHTRQLQEFLVSPISHTRIATIQRAYDIFRHLDQQHRGLLDINQLYHALSLFSSSSKFSRAEVEKIFTIAASHQDGFLRFADFYSIFACLTLMKTKFGTETTFLTHTQIKSALLEAGLNVNTTHLQHMFAIKAGGDNITDYDPTDITNETTQIDFAQLLEIFISAPRTESDLFLSSWYKAGRTNFLLHKQHLEVSPMQDFVAGTGAGIALTLVGHPFDTIKVRMQTGKFSNPIAAVRETILREGPFAVYKGMSGPMFTIPLINAIVFAAYGHGQSILKKLTSSQTDDNQLPLWQIALAGAYAGVINCIIACPVELVKTRLQIQYGEQGSFRGPFDCVQHILRASGIKGLFRGMSATIYREVFGYAAQFYMYEQFRRIFMKRGNKSEFELTTSELLFAGGAAGLGGWVFSYPMDYIKSQIQAEPWNKKSRFKKHPLLFDGGFFSCAQATIKRHGFKKLWSGFSVCALRAFPANSAGFYAYETIKLWYGNNVIKPPQPKI